MSLNFDEELQKYMGAVQLQLIRLTCQNSELSEKLDISNKEIARFNELQSVGDNK